MYDCSTRQQCGVMALTPQSSAPRVPIPGHRSPPSSRARGKVRPHFTSAITEGSKPELPPENSEVRPTARGSAVTSNDQAVTVLPEDGYCCKIGSWEAK